MKYLIVFEQMIYGNVKHHRLSPIVRCKSCSYRVRGPQVAGLSGMQFQLKEMDMNQDTRPFSLMTALHFQMQNTTINSSRNAHT
jgi:hypothetical protein